MKCFGCVKGAAVLCAAVLSVSSLTAETIEFNWNGNSSSVDIPGDIAGLVNSNKGLIESALTRAGVTQADFDAAIDIVNDQYADIMDELGTMTPYTTAVNGLDDFCDDLCDTIPNTQVLQNVWAESWLGMLIPNVKFGLGVNAGVAMLNIEAIKNVAQALSIDAGDLPDKLVFPTATADIRLGGVILPFDVGFTLSSLDTSKIGALDDAIDPCGFEYFSIGGDIRYKLIDTKGKLFRARVSASAGGYYTKGSIKVADSGCEASMDFKNTTLFLAAQASAKALCFVPFLGARLAFTKTKVEWEANADWNQILDYDDDDTIGDVMSWGILPTHFEDDADSGWKLRPQIYGGLGFNFPVVALSISGSYDFVAGIPGGVFSLRFGWM